MNHSPIPMYNNLQAKKLKFFVVQHSKIQVGRILFLDTKCSEKLCDHQNVLLNNNKSCGCFRLKSSRSNLIYMHSICFSTEIGETKTMRKFSSLKFLDTFVKGNLSMYIRALRLQSFNDTYDYIVDYLKEIVGLFIY